MCVLDTVDELMEAEDGDASRSQSERKTKTTDYSLEKHLCPHMTLRLQAAKCACTQTCMHTHRAEQRLYRFT